VPRGVQVRAMLAADQPEVSEDLSASEMTVEAAVEVGFRIL
jgi:hypothetical protein